MTAWTHSDLVRIARAWLFRHGHGVVFSEFQYMGHDEFPDGLGFRPFLDYTVLIECKASRSDFLADAKKPFRLNPEHGMGDFRWYMAPAGLIRPDELPEHWGLLEVQPNGRVCKTVCLAYIQKTNTENWRDLHARRDVQQFQKNALAEQRLMYAAARRLTVRECWDILGTPEGQRVTWQAAHPAQAPAAARAGAPVRAQEG